MKQKFKKQIKIGVKIKILELKIKNQSKKGKNQSKLDKIWCKMGKIRCLVIKSLPKTPYFKKLEFLPKIGANKPKL